MSDGKLLLYSSSASQWAMVPHLGLAEKRFAPDDYEVKSIDLFGGGNFHPDYVSVNPNATLPSLASPSVKDVLIDSRPILEHLNELRPSTNNLAAKDPSAQARAAEIIDIVHDDNLTTNLILLQARDKEEMEAKRASMWKDFVVNRQRMVERFRTELPEHPFYKSKLEDTTPIFNLYTSEEVSGPQFDGFYQKSKDSYDDFAAGLKKLDAALVLPYAAGSDLTLADLHVVPWLSHAMWGAGATEVNDFAPLEALIGKSVPGFKVGQRVKEWWTTMGQRDSFKQVYPKLH